MILPALSVRQPWTWGIVHAGKDIENRTWWTSRRGRILLHAGKVLDGRREDALDSCYEWAAQAGIDAPRSLDDLPLGGIVGSVEIVDCVTHSESRWFFGPYGLVLRDPRPLPFFPCKGQLGFFKVDYPYEVAA